VSRPAARQLIAFGAALTVLGLAIAGTSPVMTSESTQQTAGGLGLLAGWAVLALGIHRFGREAR
jgi:hypothetical protein